MGRAARQRSELTGLHRLLTRAAADQMLFAFVRGVKAANARISIPTAIIAFYQDFGVTDYDVNSAKMTYLRILAETNRQSAQLSDQLNQLQEL